MTNINEVKQYIFVNIKCNLSISDIAYFFKISRQYLHAFFKKECGVTIMNYIINKKLEMAAVDLLITSNDLITISKQYNFRTVTYFRHRFNLKFNVMPEEFIEKYLGDDCPKSAQC
ncbi:helix-turn-helix transcriptional regulator [Citrobacter sp. wls619]|uniref:helix-turn-helix transcriptional regulator n=1 Tax=Citrobacter sp. wls619 TaxID=2576432 RepID=UPI0010C9B8F1|nr:helix-turn-helix transcriptional regulator [Citrobacter sp. wls619]